MSTHDSNEVDQKGKLLLQSFQSYQAIVVSRRNAVVILRASVTIATERLNHEEAQLKKDEVELTRLHKLLHPEEE